MLITGLPVQVIPNSNYVISGVSNNDSNYLSTTCGNITYNNNQTAVLTTSNTGLCSKNGTCNNCNLAMASTFFIYVRVVSQTDMKPSSSAPIVTDSIAMTTGQQIPTYELPGFFDC